MDRNTLYITPITRHTLTICPPGGCSSTYNSNNTATPGQTGTAGGGFWSGAATGGILGYLFGSRNNIGHYGGGYQRPYASSWGGSSWGGGRSMFGSGGTTSFGRSMSSGTRTASGEFFIYQHFKTTL
jgi:hypothetical protein